MGDRIRLEIADGIADVRLARPAKMNALDPATFQAIAETGERLKTEKGLRAVVLSGEGRAFCAGLDLERVTAAAAGESILPFADLTAPSHGPANWAQHIVWLWRALPIPVIAAVHGIAFGGGFQLALGADIRYLAPDARMSIAEIKWGLVPDMAGTQLMRALVRDDIARELTYTGRVFNAEEALAFGFATRVVEDPHAAAMATARQIAARSPDAVRAAKRLLNQVSIGDPAGGFAAERAEQRQLLARPNQVEAVAANLENRPARFVDTAA